MLSHECATLSRAKVADAATVECTLRLCRINKHGFCTSFPVSLSSFTNSVPKWRNCAICYHVFWTLRLIVRFIVQDNLLKLNYYQEYRNQSCSIGLFTRQSRSVQLHSRTLRLGYVGLKFLPARSNVSMSNSCGSVCVCHKSVFYRNGWTNRAGFWHGSFFDLSHTVL